MPILARIYSPQDFGAVALFTSFIAVISVAAGLRYEMAIVVEDDDKKALALTQLAIILNIAVGLFCWIIILLFQSVIASTFNITNPIWLHFIPITIVLTGIATSLTHWFNRERNYKRITSNRINSTVAASAFKWIYPSLNVVMGNGLILGHIFGQIVSVIHFWVRSSIKLTHLDKTLIKQVAKKYLHFPIYSTSAALINILAVNMPVFLISSFDGEMATGYFGNAYKLTYLPMSMLALSMGQVFYERVARLKADRGITAKMSHDLFNFLFLIGVIPVVVIAVWGDSIIPFVLGDEWVPAGEYGQILILFYFLMFLTSPFSSAFEAYNKLKVQLAYNISFLVTTSAGMFIVYALGMGTLDAITCFAVIGLIMRLVILNYFFILFGKNLFVKSILGIVAVLILIWLGFIIKHGLT